MVGIGLGPALGVGQGRLVGRGVMDSPVVAAVVGVLKSGLASLVRGRSRSGGEWSKR